MNEIKVTNCHECPLAEWHEAIGYYNCNHPIGNKVNDELFTKQLPKDNIHESCPLKESSLIVTI